ncbi:hypothetical protein BC826DRAFT_1113483 [Russula brevipes]|nr:hypothetical protein BC826DRAFT_1113483 [Russula brevipes]
MHWLSLCKLACACALVPVALFLAGTLGPSWFAVLEVPQNAGYILTTRGTARPGPASLNTGVAAGTPTKRGECRPKGTQGGPRAANPTAKEQVALPLLADMDPDSIQAAIQQLFDVSIMLDALRSMVSLARCAS